MEQNLGGDRPTLQGAEKAHRKANTRGFRAGEAQASEKSKARDLRQRQTRTVQEWFQPVLLPHSKACPRCPDSGKALRAET